MIEDNLALTRRWFAEVWNQKNTATIRELISPACVAHGASDTGDDLRGPEGWVELQTRLVDAFPDIHIDLHEVMGVGDLVAVRWTATMHHNGNGLGVEATGAHITINGMGFARFENGKVVETWDMWDRMAMFQQIEAARAERSASA
jgi:steroid delta-isomerase-like uncharacterized protein